ncbi:MAG: ATP-binding protein [Desulfuromonadaceae bacterium]
MRHKLIPAGLSLRISLLIFVFLPLIAILTGAGLYSLRHLELRIEERMQEDLELIARAIRGPLQNSLEQEREGSVQQALDSLFSLKRVYGAYVYDRDGERIAASGAREPQIGSSHLVELAEKGDHLGEYQESEDDVQVYSYFVPLSDLAGRNIGLLQLTRDGRDFREYIAGVRRQTLLFLGLLALVLLATIVFGHHQVIGRNLGRLVQSMARIERGQRRHRAAATGPREIRQLALGMNAMLDSMERSERELEQQREEQSQLERELQQSQKMAAIGGLAAGVAHELGTPLSVVSGKAQRMLRKADRDGLPPTARKEVEEILQAVRRTEQIVRQLLDFGRQNPLRKRPLRMDEILQGAVAQLRQNPCASEVELRCAPNPQPDAPPPLLEVDRVRLEQALVNLLLNAIHAAGSGGIVEYGWFTRADSDGEYIGFYVADNGPGVAEEIRGKLFDPFFTTKEVGKGTGLGLAVAHAAALDHAGVLEVGTSELGGACFTMTFHIS